MPTAPGRRRDPETHPVSAWLNGEHTMKHTPSPLIEQYGVIGDMQTSAHVCDDGSMDWLCLPRFDSDAVFTAMLGEREHGSWRLAPATAFEAGHAATRHYVGDTAVLRSVWTTPTGTVQVTDFMPPRDGAPRVIRIVEGVSGKVPMRSVWRPRMGYGRINPWIHTVDGRVVAEAGAHALWLDTTVEREVQDGAAVSTFMAEAGQSVAFVLSWAPSHDEPPRIPSPEAALAATYAFWEDWAGQCTYAGPYRDAVIRSLVTLKMMIYEPSGGIVAAPTTSLPEEIGGARNWDYRATWLRDAATTLNALLGAGYREEAVAWRRWLLRAVAGDPENLQILYGIGGERELPERVLQWLPGYEGSAPVRIGNGAASQLQLDVYGEAIETLYLAHQAGVAHCADTAALHQRLVRQLATCWQEPDEGIWEVRGPRRHFVHSKVMAWAAVHRTIRLAEEGVLDVDLFELVELREAIHSEVCEKGFDRGRGTFTQSYGSTELDAALLLIPRVGFLPPDDPRVTGTIDAIQRELTSPDGLVWRYATAGDRAGVDGLVGDEGAFVLCTFWMVDALALAGRLEEAQELFEHVLSLRSDLGLLAEEYHPKFGRQLGNYPQAFSHMGLVESALLLDQLLAERGSEACALPPGAVPVQQRPAALALSSRI
ncbi:glycoside hydrolase family 15 protein [Streptomyces griseofuscus]|uniref:glycoside hydrolase family 15 protein n=1 Tax=Streptomyces griseofuscus TaxID=146922 RepID=UPI00369A69AB